MASDTEDDDLASLRMAALKTLKPKVQPIQQLVSVSGMNRPHQSTALEEYPASADIVSEFHYQPEPLPEPEPGVYPNQDMTVPPPSLPRSLHISGLQQLPSHVPVWRSTFPNRRPGPRNFQPLGFNLNNRLPFNARIPHRTFGDRGRPSFDRGRRFQRRGYQPDRKGHAFFNRPPGPISGVAESHKPSVEDSAGGNLIVIRPRGTDKSISAGGDNTVMLRKEENVPPPGKLTAREGSARPKLSLPQDKYHSSLAVPSAAEQNVEGSSSVLKPRDKFSRYNDSDSEEEEEEEEHSDIDNITNEIDNFLNDRNTEDTAIHRNVEQSDSEVAETSFKVEVHKLDISEDEDDKHDAENDEESKDLEALVANDDKSDLDALASEDASLADVADIEVDEAVDFLEPVESGTEMAGNVINDPNGLNQSVLAKENDKSGKSSNSPKSSSSSSSSSPSSSSSSESSDSSTDNENEEKEDEIVATKSSSDDLDDILSKDAPDKTEVNCVSPAKDPELTDLSSLAILSPNQHISPTHSPLRPLVQRSTSPISPDPLSPKISNFRRSMTRSPIGTENYHKSSLSPNKTSPFGQRPKSPTPLLRRPLSPKCASRSPERKKGRPISTGQLSNHRRRSISPKEKFYERRRSISPRGRPRRRSVSPRRKNIPRKKSGSPFVSKRLSNSPHRPSSPLKNTIRDPSTSQRSRSPAGSVRQTYLRKGNGSPVGREKRAERFGGKYYGRDSKSSSGRSRNEDKYNRVSSGSRYQRSRSHSRERYKKPIEVNTGKDSPHRMGEKSNCERKQVAKLPPPQIDLDKLTPEERAKIEARRKKFSSNEITIDPDKKVSLKSIKERPKKQKKSKEKGSVKSGEAFDAGEVKVPRKHKKDFSEADSSTKKYSHTSEKSINSLGRSIKDRLGHAKLSNHIYHADPVSDDDDDDDDDIDEHINKRLTSSIVKAKPFKANIPDEKLKIEVQVSPKKTKLKAKPDFSKVYSVSAKRNIVEEDEEEEEEETVVVKKMKKHKKKKKKFSREDREVGLIVAGDSEDGVKEEPSDELVKPTRPSIMERLGKKVSLEPAVKKDKRKKRKQPTDEPMTELDAKIQKIKEKNAAIARRQQEIARDKEIYG